MDYYKLLNEDGSSPYRGFKWPLPLGGNPGEWLPKIAGKLIECERGYHVVTLDQVLEWAAPVLWRVEVKGRVIKGEGKCMVRQARLVERVETWNERTLRLFGADCAERVLHIYEKKVIGDLRPREAIAAARAFAHGEITREQLSAARDAARAAAWDAAWAAANAAAWDAERRWQVKRLMETYLGVQLEEE